MSFQVLVDIGNMMYGLFGHGYIFALVIIAVLAIVLISVRAHFSAMLVVLIPVLLGFAVNAADTTAISFPPWIYYVVFIVAGIMFAVMFYINILSN